MYKAIVGDSSDHIPVGIPYLERDKKERERIILHLVNTYNSIDDLLKNVFSCITPMLLLLKTFPMHCQLDST